MQSSRATAPSTARHSAACTAARGRSGLSTPTLTSQKMQDLTRHPGIPNVKKGNKKKRVLLVIQKTITNMITRSFVTHFWKLISCKLPLFGQSRYKPHGLRGLGILGRWCKYVYVVQVEKPIIGGFFPWRRLQ